MAFIVSFKPSGVTSEKYAEIITKLEEVGAGAPKGRSYHVCHGDPSNIHVTEVWETMEDFQAFGETLMPILQSFDVDPGQPDIQPVNNIIHG
jgi:hypothetical protein